MEISFLKSFETKYKLAVTVLTRVAAKTTQLSTAWFHKEHHHCHHHKNCAELVCVVNSLTYSVLLSLILFSHDNSIYFTT